MMITVVTLIDLLYSYLLAMSLYNILSEISNLAKMNINRHTHTHDHSVYLLLF